ncbi:ASCH domain-containing protein [Kitasatospora sp. NPDC015120]|uniref:ASCH domain-containing protein n=1 Tax=Kitasatospora sp. NPDC015120 TaxID=3364023 RepID=UPI0036F4603A
MPTTGTAADRRSAQQTLHLRPEYHALVAAGVKTIEVRTASPAKAAIRPGDTITFHTEEAAPATCRVVRITRYPDFVALLDHEQAAAINPGTTPHGILTALRAIYPPEKETRGALAIEIQLLPPIGRPW